MKTKRLAMIGLCLVIFLPCLGDLNAETVLTADEAVALALERNLGLERVRIETEGKKRESSRSWNGLLPSLEAGASYGRGISFGADLPPGREEWTPAISFSASVSLSPSIVTKMEQLRADYESGLLSHEAARQDLELAVRKAFYQIILLGAGVEQAERNIAAAQSRYDEAAAKARVGLASRLDELSARVDLENLRPARRNAETQYRNALEDFARVLGLPEGESLLLSGDLEMDGDFGDPGGPDGGRGETGTAPGRESLAVMVSRKSLSALEAQRRTLWTETFVPSLSLSWSGNTSFTNDAWAWSESGSFSVGLRIHLDHFLPASPSRTKIAAMDDRIALQRIQIAEAMDSQRLQIRQYERAIEQSLESIEALSLNVELARETHTMWEEAYRRGSAGLQQLRSASDSLFQAENQLRQERYKLLAAILDLEKALNIPFGTLLRSGGD